MASVHALVDKSMRVKWNPLLKAKSEKKIREIINKAHCPFCDRDDELLNSGKSSVCPLSNGNPCGGSTLVCCRGLYDPIHKINFCDAMPITFEELHAHIVKVRDFILALKNEPDKEW